MQTCKFTVNFYCTAEDVILIRQSSIIYINLPHDPKIIIILKKYTLVLNDIVLSSLQYSTIFLDILKYVQSNISLTSRLFFVQKYRTMLTRLLTLALVAASWHATDACTCSLDHPQTHFCNSDFGMSKIGKNILIMNSTMYKTIFKLNYICLVRYIRTHM